MMTDCSGEVTFLGYSFRYQTLPHDDGRSRITFIPNADVPDDVLLAFAQEMIHAMHEQLTAEPFDGRVANAALFALRRRR